MNTTQRFKITSMITRNSARTMGIPIPMWLTAGVGMLVLTGCSLFLSRKAADIVSLVMIGVQTLEILLTIPFVENALKQNERGDTHAQN